MSHIHPSDLLSFMDGFLKGKTVVYNATVFFHKCHRIETEGYGLGGDIYFGGPEQCDLRRRHRDKLPGHAIIIERPFCCFYTAHNEIAIFFDENECEISAELFE